MINYAKCTIDYFPTQPSQTLFPKTAYTGFDGIITITHNHVKSLTQAKPSFSYSTTQHVITVCYRLRNSLSPQTPLCGS